MCVYCWINNVKIEFSLFALWSLFISHIIDAIYSAAHYVCIPNNQINPSFKIIVYTITAFILPFVLNKIINISLVHNFLLKSVHKTIHPDIFDDIIDYKETPMKVFIKNCDVYYIGQFKLREEKGLESWIVLVDYIAANVSNSETHFDPDNTGMNSTVAINLRDVERIELFYKDGSDAWDKINNSVN